MSTAAVAATVRPGWNRLLATGAFAGIAASIVNAALFYLARALGAMPQDVGVPRGP